MLGEKHRWVAPVVPFVVYMAAGSLEPSAAQQGGAAIGLAIPYAFYPLLYTLKIALTLVAVALVWPGYPPFPRRVSPLALGIGLAGIVVWVGLWRLAIDQKVLELLGLGRFVDLGARGAFNPFEQLADRPALVWAFLAVRFLGLVLVVPVIEEFFLRGFLMRFVMAPDWWNVPFGTVDKAALAVSVVVPALSHPAEMLPAVVWFAMVTWLMVKTRSFWDCVVAHGITNLLLGAYVVVFGQWTLW